MSKTYSLSGHDIIAFVDREISAFEAGSRPKISRKMYAAPQAEIFYRQSFRASFEEHFTSEHDLLLARLYAVSRLTEIVNGWIKAEEASRKRAWNKIRNQKAAE